MPNRIGQRFLVASLIAVALMPWNAAPLAGQATDTLTRRGSHAMSWGRETFVLSEVLEYAPAVAGRALSYDLIGWTGGASHRVWAKADGGIATRGGGTHGEYQLLYGRLVSPWWDAQVGVRVDQLAESGSSASRGGAVVGLQGLAPGWFEVEPSVFVSTGGFVSLDVTASYDLFLTQRLVLQPRLESSVALNDDADFGSGSGLSSTSFGLRTRFELRREFAPYVGVVWDRSYGRTAELTGLSGAAAGETRVVAGLRLWR
jgi:copper resistance protein B